MTDREFPSHKRLFRYHYYPLILVALAAAVRIYLYFFTYIISRDGVTYITLGGYFKQGSLAKGLGHDYHPLYSMLIAVLSCFLKDSQLAGQIISIVAGSLLVIPIFYLGKSLFNESIAFVTGLLVAFHPYLARISADVVSDPLYILFFATGICVGWSALKRRSLPCFFLTGACTAFAYLTRPEGIGIIIVIGFWILIVDGMRFEFPSRRGLVSLLLLVLAFLIFASPYLVYLKKDTGHWILTRKKSIKTLMGVEKSKSEFRNTRNQQIRTENLLRQGRAGISKLNDIGKHPPVVISNIYLENIKKFFNLSTRLASTFHWPLFFLWLVGILKCRGIARFDKGQWFILSFYLLYLPILYLLLLNVGYVSRRHLLPLIVIGLFWAAIGVEESKNWILRKMYKLNRASYLSPMGISVIILCMTIAILLPKTLKHQRSDKIWIKKAGIWITKNGPSNPKIMSSDPRVAYYAGGVNIATLPGKTFQEIEGLAQKERVDFVVLKSDQTGMDRSDSILDCSKTLNLVHQLAEVRGGKILIYQVLNQ